MLMADARELLADQAHIMWAHWMKYQFSRCTTDYDGAVIIPAEFAKRWRRLLETDYADLTEAERESDREQADRMRTALADAGLTIVPEAELQRLKDVEAASLRLFTVQEPTDER